MRIAGLALFIAVALVACKDKPKDPAKPIADPPIGNTGSAAGSGSAAAPPSYVVDIAPFDKTCTTDEDCALVYVYPCEHRCGCAQHTIAAKEVVKFRAAAEAIKCPPEDTTRERIQCGSCMSPTPRCQAGTCVAVRE